MFYDTEKNDHGLPFNPFKSCIIPRPIGWITSFDKDKNINLAPYSYFNAVSDVPPMIMFSTTTKRNEGTGKDTLTNIEETKEFVVNLVTWDLKQEMNISSADFDPKINELEKADLLTLPSKLVQPPRVQGSPIHLECVYYKSVQLPTVDDSHTNRIVIANVVGIYIQDDIIVDGKIDMTRFKPIARLGYMDYAIVNNSFSMERPCLNRAINNKK